MESASAGRIDLCFLTEKGNAAWRGLISLLRQVGGVGGGEPASCGASQVKLRRTDILVLCYPECHLAHRGIWIAEIV